jgi:hydrogenase maturation protein HypF
VGFRPFVHRIATEPGLAGFVGNDSGAVLTEVQGPGANIAEFGHRLLAQAPPLARIGAVTVTDLAVDTLAGNNFRIVAELGLIARLLASSPTSNLATKPEPLRL